MGRWAGWPKWAKWGGEGSGGPTTYSITGTINDADGNGLDGVTVTLTGDASDSTTTSGGGAYEFTGLSAGSYTVTPTKAGLTFNPTSAAVTITTANKTAATMASVWGITGTINDSAGAGLSGVLVTLSGDASATDTTDGSGAYSFPNLANGSYTVTPTKAGSTFSPASDNVTVSGADKVATTMAQAWEITGQILDSAGSPLSGVLVTLSGDASDTDTTDGSGNYSFENLADGSYTVTPTVTGKAITPTSTNVTVSGGNQTGKDFATSQQWPVFENFELDTVAQNAATLNAKNTHYGVVVAATDVQLDDYGAMTSITGNILDQCITVGADAAGAEALVLAGDGFTPSGDRVLVCEGFFNATGVNTQTEFYVRSADGQEGFHAYLVASGEAYLRTSTGGSWTDKYGPIATTTNPHDQGWHLFCCQYNFSDNAIYFRVIELGSGSEDSGWVGGGTITPTFDANTELRSFFPISRCDSGIVGVAQCYIADVSLSGYNLANAGVSNYLEVP